MLIMNTIESQYLEALSGRQVIAQGEALCDSAPVTLVVPHIDIIQGGAVAWGKKDNVE